MRCRTFLPVLLHPSACKEPFPRRALKTNKKPRTCAAAFFPPSGGMIASCAGTKTPRALPHGDTPTAAGHDEKSDLRA